MYEVDPGFELFDNVPFCKDSCTIIFRGCWVGEGEKGARFFKAVAEATGCRVEGYNCQTVRGKDKDLPGPRTGQKTPRVVYNPGDDDVTRYQPDAVRKGDKK